MEKQTDTDEIERELRATLSARREVGPDYDDHLIESFMQKLNQRALAAPAPQPSTGHGPTPNQRLALGIVSLVFLVPLAAVTISDGGLLAFGIICFVVLGINIAFNARG
jgi:hypothetical protein